MTIQEALETGLDHHRAGRYAEAERLCRQVMAVAPNHPDALHLLGAVAHLAGKLDAAAELIGRAIAIDPNVADYHNNLGNIFSDLRQFERAIGCFAAAIRLQPDFAVAHNNRAVALAKTGKLEAAAQSCHKAIAIKPDYPQAFNNLGNILQSQGLIGQALAAYRRAIELQPDYAEAHNNFANALRLSGAVDEAIAAYRAALQLMSDKAEIYSNLGNALVSLGRHDEAAQAYWQALRLRPDDAIVERNLLFTMYYQPANDARGIYQQARLWNEHHAKPLAREIQPHQNDRTADRRLRIGYVSADFREHVIGWNLLPVLREHDHNQFEIVCYSDVLQPDEMTAKCRAAADVWQHVAGLSHAALAEKIRADEIDILVDLALHASGSRLLTFARKPAPVQVSYLSYAGTSGMDAIDYRLTDPFLDPPGTDMSIYSERSICLPRTYWCYEPGGATPEVGELPARTAGWVTFGCLNNFAKVSKPTIELWARLMAAVPSSRLILHCPASSAREAIIRTMESQGVVPDRIEFLARQPWQRYIETYQRIDLGLNPFPFAGGITTCDSLWMGVPVVTLGSGPTSVSRSGVSILNNVGLEEMVAGSEDEYVAIAAGLCKGLMRLAGLRAGLRQRLRGSALMDSNGFARAIEGAYHRMWRGWCDGS